MVTETKLEACPSETLLERLFDGELEESAPLEAHLERCRRCARYYERLAALEALSRKALAAPPVEPARWEALGAALQDAMASGQTASSRPKIVAFRRPAGLLAIAAALLLFALGALVLRAGSGPAGMERFAFEMHAGANAAEVVELRCDAANGYSAGVVYPRDNSEPVVIMLGRL